MIDRFVRRQRARPVPAECRSTYGRLPSMPSTGVGRPCTATARKALPSRWNKLPNWASQMPGCIFQYRLKYRLADHRANCEMTLKHVGGRGLLLQGFAQLVEQAGVLDGDDGLGSEIL